MELQELQYVAVGTGVAICGVVMFCTKYLLDAERDYPREKFPVTPEDHSRGASIGIAIGIAWSILDIMYNQYMERSVWDLSAWGLRSAVFASCFLAGSATFSELSRAVRCMKGYPPHTFK